MLEFKISEKQQALMSDLSVREVSKVSMLPHFSRVIDDWRMTAVG